MIRLTTLGEGDHAFICNQELPNNFPIIITLRICVRLPNLEKLLDSSGLQINA